METNYPTARETEDAASKEKMKRALKIAAEAANNVMGFSPVANCYQPAIAILAAAIYKTL